MECLKSLDIKIFIAIVAGISTTFTLWVTWLLKNKELKHNVTQEKLKQLYSKEIEVYEDLYALTLEYTRQKYLIGRENLSLKNYIETEHSVYVKVIRNIFNTVNKNIFYISDSLEKKHISLSDNFLKNFKDYKDFENEHPKISPKFVENENEIENGKIRNPLLTEKEKLLDEAQKKFYEENKEEVKKLLEQIEEDFINLRNNYKKEKDTLWQWFTKKCYFII
jgi:hypothetical protein